MAKAKKVRIGVIGAGGIARRRTIPGMLKAKNCELTAVMDVANIEEIAKEFKVKKAYTRERDLLKDPDVDAVYIASPVNVHLKQIKMAAAAGKHILCEKPLTMSLKQAKEAVAVCKKNKVFLQEGYMMKFHGAHQKIAELVKKKQIGKVVYMRAQLACWYPPIKGAWRQDPRTGGGGSLVDMATHLYDLLESFVGPVKRIAAITGNQVQKYKSEDSATIVLEFASGAHATIDSFFCVPDDASRTRLEIYGSKGAILSEGTIGQGDGGKLEAILGIQPGGYAASQSKNAAPVFKNIAFPKINPYTAECEYFAGCILKKRQPKINGIDNILHLVNLTEKAYASSKQKRILTV